jgi:hypothetical protein
MRPAPFRIFGHPEAALGQQLPVAGVLNRLVSGTGSRVSKLHAGSESEEKREPVSDIDTGMADRRLEKRTLLRPSSPIVIYEYTPFCNGPVDVNCSPIVTPPSSRFCPWSTLRPPHYAVRGSGEPI